MENLHTEGEAAENHEETFDIFSALLSVVLSVGNPLSPSTPVGSACALSTQKRAYPEPRCSKMVPSSGCNSSPSEGDNYIKDFFREMSKGQKSNEMESESSRTQNEKSNVTQKTFPQDGSTDNSKVPSSSSDDVSKISSKRRKKKEIFSSNEETEIILRNTKRICNEEIYNKNPTSCARCRPYVIVINRK